MFVCFKFLPCLQHVYKIFISVVRFLHYCTSTAHISRLFRFLCLCETSAETGSRAAQRRIGRHETANFVFLFNCRSLVCRAQMKNAVPWLYPFFPAPWIPSVICNLSFFCCACSFVEQKKDENPIFFRKLLAAVHFFHSFFECCIY